MAALLADACRPAHSSTPEALSAQEECSLSQHANSSLGDFQSTEESEVTGIAEENGDCKDDEGGDKGGKAVKRWTAEEHALLERLVEKHGITERNWSFIAAQITGRTGKQCRERWLNHLRPNINKGPWTAEEDRILAKYHSEWGATWSKIAKCLSGRTENSIKNRWNTLYRCKDLVKRRRYSALASYVALIRAGVSAKSSFSQAFGDSPAAVAPPVTRKDKEPSSKLAGATTQRAATRVAAVAAAAADVVAAASVSTSAPSSPFAPHAARVVAAALEQSQPSSPCKSAEQAEPSDAPLTRRRLSSSALASTSEGSDTTDAAPAATAASPKAFTDMATQTEPAFEAQNGSSLMMESTGSLLMDQMAQMTGRMLPVQGLPPLSGNLSAALMQSTDGGMILQSGAFRKRSLAAQHAATTIPVAKVARRTLASADAAAASRGAENVRLPVQVLEALLSMAGWRRNQAAVRRSQSVPDFQQPGFGASLPASTSSWEAHTMSMLGAAHSLAGFSGCDSFGLMDAEDDVANMLVDYEYGCTADDVYGASVSRAAEDMYHTADMQPGLHSVLQQDAVMQQDSLKDEHTQHVDDLMADQGLMGDMQVAGSAMGADAATGYAADMYPMAVEQDEAESALGLTFLNDFLTDLEVPCL